jgi:hypothetical protein
LSDLPSFPACLIRRTCRVLELREILNTLWGIIRNPIKLSLVDSVCRSTNALAKNFELANFNAGFFPGCYNSCDQILDYYQQYFPNTNNTLSCSIRRAEVSVLFLVGLFEISLTATSAIFSENYLFVALIVLLDVSLSALHLLLPSSPFVPP